MNPNYKPSLVLGPIGTEQARLTLSEIPLDASLEIKIEFLKRCLRKAKSDMPRILAERLYEDIQQAYKVGAVTVDVEEAVSKADVTRFPHRLQDLLTTEHIELHTNWILDPEGHPTSDQQVLRYRSSEAITILAMLLTLLEDPKYEDLYFLQLERHIEFGKDNDWSQQIAAELEMVYDQLAELELDDSPDEDRNTDVFTRWFSLHSQLTALFEEHGIVREQFMEEEELKYMDDAFLSLSMINVAANMYEYLPMDMMIQSIIDSGTCNIQTNAYVHEIQIELDHLEAELKAEPIEKITRIDRNQLAIWLYHALRQAGLAPRATLQEIKEICNTGHGILKLHIPKGNAWCARILTSLANKLGVDQSKIRVRNGKKTLTADNMLRAVKRNKDLTGNAVITGILSRLDSVTIEDVYN